MNYKVKTPFIELYEELSVLNGANAKNTQIKLLNEWVDMNGNKVKLNQAVSSTTKTPTAPISYKEKFKKILDFNEQYLPPNIKTWRVETLKETSDEVLVHYAEVSDINQKREVVVSLCKTTNPPDQWIIGENVYKPNSSIIASKRTANGTGYIDLLVALKDFMELPARGGKAYSAIL